MSDDGMTEYDPVILLNAKPNSALAEAYKHLRTSLMLSSPEKPPQTILITSSQPSEGKTTTSVNLAISLAQTGARVLLIDADMRHPRHHKLLGVQGAPGLSNILSGNMRVTEIMDAVRVHEATGVNCLCAGTVPPNPAELLGSKQMARLIESMEASYDYVIIDSPPVGFFTDSMVLATVVDGVFLVVDGNKYAHDLARRTRRLLMSLSVKLYGVVLNNVKQTHHDYYYYDKYYRPADTEAEAA
jgi:capsular exopolysaccharide synthesis family protein